MCNVQKSITRSWLPWSTDKIITGILSLRIPITEIHLPHGALAWVENLAKQKLEHSTSLRIFLIQWYMCWALPQWRTQSQERFCWLNWRCSRVYFWLPLLIETNETVRSVALMWARGSSSLHLCIPSVLQALGLCLESGTVSARCRCHQHLSCRCCWTATPLHPWTFSWRVFSHLTSGKTQIAN